MSDITNITITNIKGFFDQNNSFEVQIKPNKVNLLVAPNGFERLSIAEGFEHINSKRLDLPNKMYYNRNTNLLPTVSIDYEGETLIADKNANTISPKFAITVINSGLKGDAVVRRNKITL